VSWEYVHLVTHAFPIVLSVTGAGVGLIGWALRRESLERWGLVAILLAGVGAIPAYVSGISAADVVADRTFVTPGIVQTHRTWATWALILLVTAGIFAVFSLFQPKDARLRRFVLFIGLAAATLVGFTAYRGGRIVHGAEGEAARAERSKEAAPAAEPVPSATDSTATDSTAPSPPAADSAGGAS
jgi:uncharacterized membrane protein